MDPLVLVLVPGVLGGVVLALLFARKPHGPRSEGPFEKEPISTDVINVARIRVGGIGGLGLVAMALVVAIAVPRIGVPLAIGLVLGGLLGAVLIAWRRRTGVMTSSSKEPGAKVILR